MNRLTDNNGICLNCEGIAYCRMDCKQKQIYDKLKYYEDLEEQGFVLKAPCKIDDTVFVKVQYSKWQPFEIIECKVSKISALSSGKGASITCHGRYNNGNYYNGNFRMSSFGKKIFTSREEAEKSLSK